MFLVWLGAVVILIAAVASFELSRLSSPATATSSASVLPSSIVMLDGVNVHVDLATTPAEQEQGLGGRTGLAANQGMLFIFPQDGEYAFWMKDMQFPIDIIWLDHTGTVMYIVPNLAPATYPKAFGPSDPSRYVLEVPAGFVAAHGVNVGDTATLP